MESEERPKRKSENLRKGSEFNRGIGNRKKKKKTDSWKKSKQTRPKRKKDRGSVSGGRG